MEIQEKIATTLAAGIAAFLVTKLIDAGWKLVTGKLPPDDDDDDLLRLAVFAGLSAIAATIARRYALRGANRFVASRKIGQ